MPPVWDGGKITVPLSLPMWIFSIMTRSFPTDAGVDAYAPRAVYTSDSEPLL